MNQVTIRVPGTTANLGPGFDCLGIALQLANRVTVRRLDHSGGSIGDGVATEALDRFFSAAKEEPFPFEWSIVGDVPRARGMGSSVTVRLGLLHGLNELAGQPLDPYRLYELCADLEGHPDNAAPAAFGGFAVSQMGAKPLTIPVDENLHFVLLIPDFEVSTPDARRALPDKLDRREAVISCANACRITAAFMSHNYEALRDSFDDYLHQPHRKPLIPFLMNVIEAGEAAGALGGWMSGSGSTICCLTEKDPKSVADAMLKASDSAGAKTVITHADNRGTIRLDA